MILGWILGWILNSQDSLGWILGWRLDYVIPGWILGWIILWILRVLDSIGYLSGERSSESCGERLPWMDSLMDYLGFPEFRAEPVFLF